MNDDFYIGYVPKAPSRIARKTIAAALTVVVAGLTGGVLLATRQPPFAASRFEFGEYRDYTGVLETWPAPMLLTSDSRYLLVAPGKHGLALADEFSGRKIDLRGSLIQRGADQMLEVQPETIHSHSAEANTAHSPPRVDLGELRLTGEIVDSKCYLGVMNPGEGKVHRGCAVRCIAGGAPPAFIARDAEGNSRFLLLAGKGGEPLGPQLAPFAAEPVEIFGRLIRVGPTFVFETELSQLRRK